jgi:hypothetical protein
MELLVNRTTRTANSTIGEFFINGNFFSYCLEPTDRGLTSSMSIEEIQEIKIPDKTCIPTGRYQVTKYYSNKNQRDVPLINKVPDYQYVEIHHGNFPGDTDGCLLLGEEKATDYVGPSNPVIEPFYNQVFAALDNNEAVWITYK